MILYVYIHVYNMKYVTQLHAFRDTFWMSSMMGHDHTVPGNRRTLASESQAWEQKSAKVADVHLCGQLRQHFCAPGHDVASLWESVNHDPRYLAAARCAAARCRWFRGISSTPCMRRQSSCSCQSRKSPHRHWAIRCAELSAVPPDSDRYDVDTR